MARLSRPLLYGGLVTIAAAAFWNTSSAPIKPAKTRAARPTTGKQMAEQWVFPTEEISLRFAKPVSNVRDAFKALVAPERQTLASNQDAIVTIPSDLADGEGSWAYTGMVKVDGMPLALLENGATHVGGYVREGEVWKKSRIVRITMPFIVLAGTDGIERTVHRYNPNDAPKPKAPPDPGFKPLDVSPALKGQIGIEFNPTQPKASAPGVAAPGPQEVKK